MADLKLTADFSDLQTLRRELLEIPKKARDSARTFEAEFARAERVLAKQARQFQKNASESQKFYSQLLRLNNETKSAERSAQVFTRELEKQDRAATKAGQAAARLESEFQKLSLSGKSARDSARVMEQAFRQQEQTTRDLAQAQAEAAARTLDLKRRFQEGYAASEAMQMQFRDLDEALRQGIITLEQYRERLAAIKQGQVGFAASANNLANRMSRTSVAIQQTGYQVGDFLVQIQSGTNWMVAFGQQATQMAGLLTLSLNPKMVILGTALSILIPLGTALGAMFMRAGQEGKGAAEGVDEFDSAIQSLDASLREWIKTREAARLGITPEQMLGGEALDEAEDNLRSAREELERLRAVQAALANAPVSPEGVVLGLLFGSGGSAAGRDAAANIEQAVANVEAAEARVRQINQRQKEEENKLRAEQESQRRAAASNMTADLQNQIRMMEVTLTYGEESVEVERLRAHQARQAYLFEAMRNNLSLEQLTNLMAIYDEYERLNQVLSRPIQGPNLPTSTTTITMPGAAGGAREGIGGLAQSLLTEMEQIEMFRTDALAQLENFNAMELEILGGQNEARLRIEEEYQNRLAALRGQERSTRLSETSSMFSALAGIAQAGGKRMLRIQATLSAAAATVAAYETAIKAAAEATTIPGRIAAYASFLATGLGAVAQIRAAGGVGGGGGGGAATVAPIPAAASAPAQRVVIEGIDRDTLISGEQLSRLFDRLYEENNERGLVFSVAR